MIKELSKYLADYVLLFSILIAILLYFYVSKSDFQTQRILSILTGISYTLWGVFHHHRLKNLTHRIMLEYFFISVFASSLLYLLTL